MFQKLEFFKIHIWFGAKKLSEQLSGGGGVGGEEWGRSEKGRKRDSDFLDRRYGGFIAIT